MSELHALFNIGDIVKFTPGYYTLKSEYLGRVLKILYNKRGTSQLALIVEFEGGWSPEVLHPDLNPNLQCWHVRVENAVLIKAAARPVTHDAKQMRVLRIEP